MLADEIVEIAATEELSGAQFGLTAPPQKLPNPNEPAVHGITAPELEASRPFGSVFVDFLAFVRGVAEKALLSDEESSDDEPAERKGSLVLKQPAPEIALAAHNGTETLWGSRVRTF